MSDKALEQFPEPPHGPPTETPESVQSPPHVAVDQETPSTEAPEPPVNKSWMTPSDYGPIRPPRRRIHQKDGPTASYRPGPGPMLQEDFLDMMQEIVPELLKQVLDSPMEPAGEASSASASSSSRGVKRPADEVNPQPSEEPAEKKPMSAEFDSSSSVQAGETFVRDEVAICSVELLQKERLDHRTESLSSEDKLDLAHMFRQGASHEALVAAYMKKKASKEIPAVGNPPDIQLKVDEAKSLEWGTVSSKHAARAVIGPEADDVRKRLSHRIMGSRSVMTVKQEDDQAPRMKARWCLLGHLDPDLIEKAELGDLQSPALSQVD